MTFDPAIAAREIDQAHLEGTAFSNLEGAAAPPTIDDAYTAQEALRTLWQPKFGPVAGLKIATTTRVMQELMGIDHPCGGMIYRDRIMHSGATIDLANYQHCVIECELCVKLGQDLPDIGRDYTRDEVRNAVGSVMAAFELIEDRNADYKTTDAKTLIADNAWNGGIVIGPDVALDTDVNLEGLRGFAMLDERPHGEGLTDDPMGALAWVANLAVRRGRPMTTDMYVITGSMIATFAIEAGQTVAFEIDGIGSVNVTAK
ncbi:MAG: fumarylacetoacetate hydrolase family protein [Pseudomonadota bacterium]